MKCKRRVLICIMFLLCVLVSAILYYFEFFSASSYEINENTIMKTKEKKTDIRESEDPLEYIIEYARVVRKVKNREIDINLPQIIFIHEEKETLENEINKTLYKAATNWMTYDFLGMEISQLHPQITCHSGKYLSVLLCYHLDSGRGDTLVNYIVVDMTNGDRVFLKDIVNDEKELASQIKKGERIHAARASVFDQYETDHSLHEYISEKTETDILEIIKNCSKEEKEFSFVYEAGQYVPTIWRKSGFYIEGNCIVIDCGDPHICIHIDEVL